MGSRGRKSAAAMSVVTIDTRRVRIEPRAAAPDEIKVIVRDLVDSMPPDHFRAEDSHLVEQYAQSIALARQAYEHLDDEGPIGADGKASSWLIVLEKAHRSSVALSMRLRLSPQSRLDPKTVARNNDPSRRMPWGDFSRD